MKTIAILGLGKTGLSLAKYFHDTSHQVWGIDDRDFLGPQQYTAAKFTHELFLGGKRPELTAVDRIFISPGFDPQHPLAREAEQRGLPLEGELDLAFSLCDGQILAITGTNGKSTTTELLGEMLKQGGLSVGVGGNLGTPFLDLVTDPNHYTHYVLEVSSFQLERIQQFRPQVAALLNLSDDHLDRHPNLADYLQAKRRIFRFQTGNDFAVYNDDDLHVLEAVEAIPSRKVPFSTAKKVRGVYGNENKITWSFADPVREFSLKNCKLTGLHNQENLCAAVACAKLIGTQDEPIQQAINQFKGLPHRVEFVAELDGTRYYDDSKATNVGATVMSLASFDEKIILILGGKDKGGDYSPLKPLIKAKTTAVLVLGEATKKIQQALAGTGELVAVADMAEAVQKAHEKATPGSTVLLAPACSSFDQYANYQERGEDFKNQVKKIASSIK